MFGRRSQSGDETISRMRGNTMKQSDSKTVRAADTQPGTTYEAPRIELVVTGNEMEREVHYAGSPSRVA